MAPAAIGTEAQLTRDSHGVDVGNVRDSSRRSTIVVVRGIIFAVRGRSGKHRCREREGAQERRNRGFEIDFHDCGPTRPSGIMNR